MMTGKEFNEYSFLPSPASNIKMEDKYLPALYYSLGVIVPIIVYSTSIVLGNW
jgi:Na+-translocating ferredoxin:NAD+ oxidoreductase RnfE subunit